MHLGKHEELASIAMLGLAVDSLDAKLIDNAVVRHVFVAIADSLVLLKTIVKHRDDRNLAIGRAVRLRNQMSENRRPELPGFL